MRCEVKGQGKRGTKESKWKKTFPGGKQHGRPPSIARRRRKVKPVPSTLRRKRQHGGAGATLKTNLRNQTKDCDLLSKTHRGSTKGEENIDVTKLTSSLKKNERTKGPTRNKLIDLSIQRKNPAQCTAKKRSRTINTDTMRGPGYGDPER